MTSFFRCSLLRSKIFNVCLFYSGIYRRHRPRVWSSVFRERKEAPKVVEGDQRVSDLADVVRSCGKVMRLVVDHDSPQVGEKLLVSIVCKTAEIH